MTEYEGPDGSIIGEYDWDTAARITLPTGAVYSPGTLNTDHEPDLSVMAPLVHDTGAGYALVSFVHCDDYGRADDPLAAASHVLRSYHPAETILGIDDFDAAELTDALETTGDLLLHRVAFLTRTGGSGQFSAHGRKAPMDSWDEFKDYCRNYDAAIVFAAGDLDRYPVESVDPESGLPIHDFSAIAEEINDAATGRAYTVVHQLIRLEGTTVVATFTDDYDATLHNAGDAKARAESQHADPHVVIDDLKAAAEDDLENTLS